MAPRRRSSVQTDDPHAEEDGPGRSHFICYRCDARVIAKDGCDCEVCANFRAGKCPCGEQMND
jgi:hypothetical protein